MCMVKQKGLKEYLEEDESLSRKMTHEEFSHIKSGFDDSGIEKAYESVQEFLNSNNGTTHTPNHATID